MSRSLTAANSIIMMSVAGLFLTPQRLQGYSTDDVMSSDPINNAQVEMGVDGKLSAGYVFVPRPQSYSLQADSLSNDFFDAWQAAQDTTKEIYFAQASIVLPALGKAWTMTNGVITNYQIMPDAGKILKPRKFTITWESSSPSPL